MYHIMIVMWSLLGISVALPICNEFATTKVVISEFQTNVASGEWLGVWSVEIGSSSNFGKTYNKWYKSPRGPTYRRDTVTFNQNNKSCDSRSFHYDILENACGVSLHQVNGSRIEQFFSQNISKYFWWYICISPDSDGGCNQGFFDLQIRDLRKKTTDDIDLNGLPLHFIAGDLYNLMGKLFAMPDVQYVWTGQECFFKGT